jgi:hypothetical protein
LKPTFNPADLFGVQMAVMTRLIVHLDERSVADGQALLIELLQLGRGLPAGQSAALEQFCHLLQAQLEASQARRPRPTGDTH